jgi:hypothetical protein
MASWQERKMVDAGWAKKLGITPAKLGLVAVLAAVLAVVLVLQLGGPDAPASTSSVPGEPRRRPRAAERTPAAVAAAKPAPRAEAPPRPPMALEDALQHDPFALAAELAKPAANDAADAAGPTKADAAGHAPDDRQLRINQAIAALNSKGVQMILLGGNEEMAIVGDRPVRVGDVIDGLRVSSITAQGIMLSDNDDQRE